MKGRIRRIIILLCGLFILTAVFSIPYFTEKQNYDLKPVNGILDLRDWNSEQDGTVTLKGDWEFYREEFVDYGQIESEGMTVQVPSGWKDYEGTGGSGFGYGTYMLQVKNAKAGMPLALRVPGMSTAYELYIDDRLVSSCGTINTGEEQSEPWVETKTITFTPDASTFSILIKVSNYTYAVGGMRYAISMGTPEQISAMGKIVADKDMFLFAALMVMAFYYFLIFLLRPDDKSSLYFVLMCVIFACRITVIGDTLIYRLVPVISYHAVVVLDFLTTVWFSIFAVIMVKQFFPKQLPRIALKLFFIYGVLISIVILFSPVSFFTSLIVLVQVMAIGIGMYGNCYLAMIFVSGRETGKNEAGLILAGGIALALAALHDVLYNDSLIQSGIGEWVAIAQFVLVLIQAFILAKRFSEAFKSVHTLSQKLMKLDAVKDEFLANTSHELRTPLNGIIGVTEALLRGGSGELSGMQRQELSVVAGSSRRLSNLVNEILDYSKMKNGDILLNIVPIRLEGLIYSITSVFKQIGKSGECEMIAELPENLPPVLADENRVTQILYNLIGNAVKFTEKGTITISAEKTGEMVEVCVSDTGIGIQEDKLEDIFKSFEQVDTSLTRRHGGTGLGLSITKQLVELHKGTITVDSRLGVGSKFRFTLPVSKKEPENNAITVDSAGLPPAAEPVNVTAAAKTGNGAPILLVDDDAFSLQASSAILAMDGYAVTGVGSGKAALEKVREGPAFSLVILDVMMPEMSGYEVCAKLRENKSIFDLPVLMLTARTSTRDIVMGFEAGANDYLSKPFEPEELLARVRTLTELKASADRAMAAEIGFLQAQIKPHFLFNTLSTIASFCSTDPGYARKLITEFASYLRQSFDFKSLDTLVPLEKELELVKSYTEIEKARFGEKLTVLFEIDKTIKARIFQLSIQPLVENAIRHGVRKKSGGGTVTISVKRLLDNVLVSVSDDGCGIEPDRLNTLLSNDEKQGIGLWNIDRRLKKLFGKGLTIESEPGKGTTVTFTIPSGGDM